MIEEVWIDNPEDLIREFNNFPNHFIYRGQSNADWPLQSSLERVIGPHWSAVEARKFEDLSLERFQSKFHLYDDDNLTPDSKLAWLAIMQHYGVPTRLLDFTDSPYVALYFALESYQPSSQLDFGVFALDFTAIMESSIGYLKTKDANFTESRASLRPRQDRIFDDVVDPRAYDIAWITEPKHHNARLDRQGGCFLVSGNRDEKLQSVLEKETYENCDMRKFRISHKLYTNLYALLRKVNVTSKSLYGDLDGLARSIRMELQVYSVHSV